MQDPRLEQELSLDLDGRLPAARRSALYERLKNDPKARALRAEMQSAHDAASSVRSKTVSSDFHRSLMRRIEAGEGSPEASFKQPVPLATRVRYLGLGAAAAAALLVAVDLASGRPESGPTASGRAANRLASSATPGDQTPSRVTLDRSPSVFSTEAGPTLAEAGRGHLHPIDGASDRSGEAASFLRLDMTGGSPGSTRGFSRGEMTLASMSPDFVSPSPWVVADEARTAFVDATTQLRHELLQTEDGDTRLLMRRVQRLEPSAQRARSAAEVLEWLARDGYVDLPMDLAGSLNTVVWVSNRVENAARRNAEDHVAMLWDLRAAREQLAGLPVEQLNAGMKVQCCDVSTAFERELLERLLRNRGPLPLRVVQLSQGAGFGTFEILSQSPGEFRILIRRSSR